MSESNESIQLAVKSMIPYMTEFAKDMAGSQEYFKQTCKSASVKSYEFLMTALQATDRDVFFLLPALRGMCEDYITLRFLRTQLPNDTDQIIEKMVLGTAQQSATVQWSFFEKAKPSQTLYFHKESASIAQENKEEVRQIMSKNGFNILNSHSFLPSVRQMASQSNLLEIYDYLYHATSSMVHFSPGVLMRMGWGELPHITFSTTHFEKYYKDFAVFYGSYLLVEFFTWQMDQGLIDKSISSEIESVKTALQNQNRWPELVTFEEMNIGALSKHLFFDSPESAKEKQKVSSPR
jgi:Family of unknown function (DUF5677)